MPWQCEHPLWKLLVDRFSAAHCREEVEHVFLVDAPRIEFILIAFVFLHSDVEIEQFIRSEQSLFDSRLVCCN